MLVAAGSIYLLLGEMKDALMLLGFVLVAKLLRQRRPTSLLSN